MKHIVTLLLLLLAPLLPLSAQTPSDTVQQLISEGLYYDALDRLEQVPDSLRTPDLVRQQTQILSAFARYDEAADLIRPLVERDSLVTDMQLLAGIYESTEAKDSALLLREVIYRRSPYSIVNILRLTQLYEEAELPFLGEAMLSRFLEKYPDNRPIRQRRAAVNYTIAQYDLAYQDFDLLYHTGDRSVNTVYYHGQSLMHQDSLDVAIPVLEEAVRITKETNPYPMLDLASIFIDQKRPDRSQYYLDKVDSLLQRTPQRLQLLSGYHDRMAETSTQLKQYSSALKHLDRVAKIEGITPDILYRQALLYRALVKPSMERGALELYLKLRNSADTDSPRLTYARQRLEQLREEDFMQKGQTPQ